MDNTGQRNFYCISRNILMACISIVFKVPYVSVSDFFKEVEFTAKVSAENPILKQFVRQTHLQSIGLLCALTINNLNTIMIY